MISEEFSKTLPKTTRIDPVDKSQPQLEGVVTGSMLDIVGSITVPVQIGDFVSEYHKILLQGRVLPA